jgi:hypothetical protein
MIDLVYEELKRIGAVTSGNQFSAEWLGMENSYMWGLRAKCRQPSVKAMANCAVRLQRASRVLAVSDKPKVADIGSRLDHLASRCVDAILAEAGANWDADS